VRTTLNTQDILSILRQMPSSILFKCPERGLVYASKGFERDFGISDVGASQGQSIVFFDPQTKTEIPENANPFSMVNSGKSISQQFRLQTQSRTMNCFVKSDILNTPLGDWVVLRVKPNSTELFADNNKHSAVSKHIVFNQLLTDFSSKLITASAHELDNIIDQALAAFGEFCDVDRCYLFEFGEQEGCMSNTHEWVAAGVTPFIDELQNIPTDTMPFFMSHISNGTFKIEDVSLIPDSAAPERELFQEQRIFSILCVSIMVGGKMYGFIGCDIIGSPYAWKPYDVEYLRRIGEMLGNTLQNLYNKRALQKAQAELVEANKQLERLANIDGLTSIANRRLFDVTLELDVARCIEQQLPLSLLLIDVDFFKQYNDTYGHVAGDAVLKKIAETLTNSCIGSDDLVARYGGEEFAVILPDTNRDSLKAIAARILRNVLFLDVYHEASIHDCSLTVSVGMVNLDNIQLESEHLKHGKQSASWLVEQADEALYRAKNSGRNCAKF